MSVIGGDAGALVGKVPGAETEAHAAAPSTRSAMRRRLDIAELYRRYGDMVYGRCRTFLCDPIEAQEATQDVFLKLHRYRDRFRGDAAPSTYLFKATTTTCLNRLRSRKRRREDLFEEVPAPENPDSVIDLVEVRQLVGFLLEREDERTTAAAIYCFVDGMTYAEAGELMGLSGGAIRKRLDGFRKRARHRLAWLETERTE